MKRSDLLTTLALFFLIFFADQFSKRWAIDFLILEKDFGFLHLALSLNEGAIFGHFSHLPPVLRVVTVSTGGAFLLFVYVVIQYFLAKRVLFLRHGMTILIAGILGNVWDRVFRGHAIDFISLRLGASMSPIFNLGDVFQWVGYLSMLYFILFRQNEIWPEKDERKMRWVNLRFQITYIATFLFVGASFAVVSGVLCYTYLKITIADVILHPDLSQESRFLTPFVFTFALMSLTFLGILFFIGRISSHRIAGPVYAFEKFIEDLMEGKSRPLRLRENDQFKRLEATAIRLREYIDSLKNK